MTTMYKNGMATTNSSPPKKEEFSSPTGVVRPTRRVIGEEYDHLRLRVW